MARTSFLLATILVVCIPTSTHAHGRMLRPASRMSGYLSGLPMPPNYNDHEMNCGGRKVQWDENNGNCGICGEPFNAKKMYERPGGIMVQHNIRTAEYLENEVIALRLQITVAHKGWHEFRICNVAHTGGVEATQACLNRTLLADEDGRTRFNEGTTSTGMFDFYLVLPARLTCDLCVIQWKWKAGNDWGCGEGQCCVGCGDRQEEFYACSDVTIRPRGIRNPTTRPTVRTTQSPTKRQPTTWRYPTTTRRPVYPTTRSPWITYQPTTRSPWITYQPTTRRTTYRPTYTYNYYPIYEYIKKFPYNYNPGSTSIKYPGSGNNVTPRSSIDAFQDMITGRNAEIVNRNGITIPVPMTNDTTSPIDVNIINDYLTRDRYCAACDNGCPFDKCYLFCPHVCSISHLRGSQG